MPVRKRLVGTGLTQQEVLVWSKITPEDSKKMREWREERKRRNNLLLVLSEMEVQAVSTLKAAGLPTSGMYDRQPDGTWRKVSTEEIDAEGDEPLEPGVTYYNGSRFMDVEKVVEEMGFACDSPEGYAVRILNHVRALRVWRRDVLEPGVSAEVRERCADRAVVKAMRLGELIKEAELKSKWEPDALKGYRFKPNGRGLNEVTKLVDQALQSLDRRASAVEVFDRVLEIAPDLVESTDQDRSLAWTDRKGKDHTLSWPGFEKRVSGRKIKIFGKRAR
jgi:hypothetical protein